MSHDFEFNFEKLNNASDGQQNADGSPGNEIFKNSSNVRNLSLVLANGKMMFLNYAYLVSGEYNPDKSTIHLFFTTHYIELKGHALEGLYLELLQHLPRQITCSDERYNEVSDAGRYVVNNIIITPKE